MPEQTPSPDDPTTTRERKTTITWWYFHQTYSSNWPVTNQLKKSTHAQKSTVATWRTRRRSEDGPIRTNCIKKATTGGRRTHWLLPATTNLRGGEFPLFTTLPIADTPESATPRRSYNRTIGGQTGKRT